MADAATLFESTDRKDLDDLQGVCFLTCPRNHPIACASACPPSIYMGRAQELIMTKPISQALSCAGGLLLVLASASYAAAHQLEQWPIQRQTQRPIHSLPW